MVKSSQKKKKKEKQTSIPVKTNSNIKPTDDFVSRYKSGGSADAPDTRRSSERKAALNRVKDTNRHIRNFGKRGGPSISLSGDIVDFRKKVAGDMMVLVDGILKEHLPLARSLYCIRGTARGHFTSLLGETEGCTATSRSNAPEP